MKLVFWLSVVLSALLVSCLACVSLPPKRPAPPAPAASCPPPVGIPVRVLQPQDLDSEKFYCEWDPKTRGMVCTDYDRFRLWEQTQLEPGEQSL